MGTKMLIGLYQIGKDQNHGAGGKVKAGCVVYEFKTEKQE